ncbi:hypothetical protein EB796_001127 [Bugula neritina]|uniref:Uncharacterized protein n=1 Tax=Bugula neritina TaxID=10212 RepID=A0A7J7KQU4_BUGNE|nr:hypothetical protein EB796_001127 [Bugula neritina]
MLLFYQLNKVICCKIYNFIVLYSLELSALYSIFSNLQVVYSITWRYHTDRDTRGTGMGFNPPKYINLETRLQLNYRT